MSLMWVPSNIDAIGNKSADRRAAIGTDLPKRIKIKNKTL